MKYFKKHISVVFIVVFFQLGFAHNLTSSNDTAKTGETKISTDYKLVWQDNFDGKRLDLKNNWKIDVDGKGGGNKELQYYRKKNISLGKEPVTGASCLIITAKKENFLSRKFTSGRISTQDKFSFKYGKIEARIKLPKTEKGLWPAFWMLGKGFPKIEWPKCGEIDIMEMGHTNGLKKGAPDRYFGGACHWGEIWNKVPSYGKATISPYSLQDDFHLYTLIWDENSIKMYLDLDKNQAAEPYCSFAITGKDENGSPAHYFNKQYFIIFNLAVGGYFTGITENKDITALNNGDAHMYIDYIRVYQKGSKNEEFTFNSGNR